MLNQGEKVYIKSRASRRSMLFIKYYLLSIISLATALAVSLGIVEQPLPAEATNFFIIALVGIFAILWLYGELKRISHGTFFFTNFRVITKTGLFRTRVDSISYRMIANVKMTQTLFEKILRVGTIDIVLNKAQQPEFFITGVHNPSRIENFVYKVLQYQEGR